LNEESKRVDMLKSFTFAFAISFHSILEGFALGVQVDPKKVGLKFGQIYRKIPLAF
jgi:hypothetical protein